MQIAGAKELFSQVLDQDLCSVCGACVGICPYFKIYQGKVARIFDCDLEKGRCYAHCPKTGVDYDLLTQLFFNQAFSEEPLGVHRRVVAAKATEKIGKGIFQNGGTVSALLVCAIETEVIKGAVVTAANGILPVPKIAASVDDILDCASSRYMASPTASVVNQAVKDGYHALGVVGTACQLTGIAQIRTNPLAKSDFQDPVNFTIGLFCTWSLDTRKLMAFLSTKLDINSITGIDVPPPPAEVFRVKTTSGQIEIPLNEIREHIPSGCSVCPDMTAEWSDVSVGAFEGRSDWNTLVVRTEKGEQLVEKAVKKGYLILDELPAESLNHLVSGALNKKKRAQDNQQQEVK